MSRRHVTVLVVGATGSIGIPVVEHAIRAGHVVRAFVRDADKARGLAPGAQIVIGDLTKPGTQWFDSNAPNEHRLVLLQGDERQAGDSSDGVIARRQIAEDRQPVVAAVT